MAKSNNTGSVASISTTILFCTFLVLKLTHIINWSWWWVCAPFWLPLAIAVVLGLVHLLFVLRAKR